MNSTTSDIFCIYDCMGNRSDKSKRDLVDRIVTEFVSPLRRLTPSDAELVIFRAIVTMNPDMLGLNATVKKILADSRDIFQELLFKSLKKSRSKVTFSSAQFGNYLLLLPNFYVSFLMIILLFDDYFIYEIIAVLNFSYYFTNCSYRYKLDNNDNG
uniref:NR LBD domain-containing protein n=1 Tax=Parascaris univalens TaxID=6257 RepID=A0A915CK51_PARUN